MSFIVKNDQSHLSKELVGGKAYNLSLLSGFNVPHWFVLPVSCFELFLEHNQIVTDLNLILKSAADTNIKKVCADVKDLLKNTSLPEKLLIDIKNELTDEYYAVRSSAVDEDGDAFSFAGMMDSFLYQKGIDEISLRIIDCYISCFSERALKYRLNKGFDINQIRCAVIIQKMIPSQKSGVLFTANPVTGVRSEFLISSTFGLGEGVVSGECQCDEYLVELFSKKITKNIFEKDFVFLRDTGQSGSSKVKIDDHLKNKESLSNEEVLKLSQVGEELSLLKKYPQDIEWAFVEGELFILQTRNITNLITPTQDQHIVFDNSNIQESYCGITTPLTFSYANEAYFRVYHQMLSLFGLSEKEIKKHEKRHWNMISFIKGRVYYNINSWYEGLLLFPSFQSNKESMEKMMGLEHSVDFVKDTKLNFSEKIKMLPTFFKCYYNLIKYFIIIDKVVENFTNQFDHEYKKFKRNEFQFYSLSKLFDLTDQIIEKITSNWFAPIINDFFVMTYHGKGVNFLKKLNVTNPEISFSNLLSGEEGVQSTEPTKFLLKIADMISEDIELKSTLIKLEPPQIRSHIKKKSPAIYSECEEYIELYGDRVIGELKLESISLRENSNFLFQCLKNYLIKGMSYASFRENELVLRKKTEKEIFSLISKQTGKVQLMKFKSILSKTRKGVKYRENMRLLRTRVFGLSRDIYLEMGRQLQTYKVIDNERDIFYLTLDELERYRIGRSVQTDIKSLINIRKKEFNEFEKSETPDDHFHTRGLVYLGNDFLMPKQFENSDDVLNGLGCYPGIVKGEVVVMSSPDEVKDINGKILCTMRTDPGWAPIFPMISGLIVERGSALSHSAIIARELGIPTIVSVPGITKTLKTGDTIEFDGGTGKILNIIN